MADPTRSVQPDSRPRSHQNAYTVTDATQLYGGMIVGLKAGRLVPWLGTDAALSAPAICEVEVLGDTSAAPAVSARVTHGATLRGLTVTGGLVTNVGVLVYAADGNSETAFTVTSNAAGAVGYLSAFHSSSDMEVTLFTVGEFLGQ